MDPTEASKLLASDLRKIARRDLDAFVRVLKTGEVDTVANPFTGGSSVPPIQQDASAIRGKLESAGLLADQEFMSGLVQTLQGLVEGPVFGIAAAFDGAGEFASGSQWGLTLEGVPIETGMIHEFYFR